MWPWNLINALGFSQYSALLEIHIDIQWLLWGLKAILGYTLLLLPNLLYALSTFKEKFQHGKIEQRKNSFEEITPYQKMFEAAEWT